MRSITLACCLALLTIGRSHAQQAAETKAEAKVADNAPATLVGTEICQACHEDISNAIKKSPHGILESDKKRGWEGKTCEACHGPGSKHAESASPDDIRNPAKLAATESAKTCLACHLNQPTHSGRIRNGHAKSQIACVSCHSVHGASGLVARKPAAVNAQCATCHSSVRAQFAKPFKHRVPEGAMSCVDCHNPHGSAQPGVTRAAAGAEPGCFSCHSDKRGPFTFEHAPVRFEGCGTCHEPHGSQNPRMLTRSDVRFVCLECHANLPSQSTAKPALGVVPPAFHDLRSARYRNCTVCHQKIHGSHVDRNLLR